MEVHTESSSAKNLVFSFHDLHSFKDFVATVIVCAPDQFIYEMDLDQAFTGLRYGLDITAKEKGESPHLEQCRHLVEEAYPEYKAGRIREGRTKLEEMEKLLRKFRSQ